MLRRLCACNHYGADTCVLSGLVVFVNCDRFIVLCCNILANPFRAWCVTQGCLPVLLYKIHYPSHIHRCNASEHCSISILLLFIAYAFCEDSKSLQHYTIPPLAYLSFTIARRDFYPRLLIPARDIPRD